MGYDQIEYGSFNMYQNLETMTSNGCNKTFNGYNKTSNNFRNNTRLFMEIAPMISDDNNFDY